MFAWPNIFGGSGTDEKTCIEDFGNFLMGCSCGVLTKILPPRDPGLICVFRSVKLVIIIANRCWKGMLMRGGGDVQSHRWRYRSGDRR